MTVETETGAGLPITSSGPYNGNGVTTVFDYDFQIQAEDELLVTRQNADLSEDVLVLTTDYTVSGVGSDTGGQITLVDAATDAPTGSKLIITYEGDYNQSVDYSNQGRIQLSLLEAALDKLTMHGRSLKQQVDRSVKVDSFSTVDLATLTTNINALGAIDTELQSIFTNMSSILAVEAEIADINTLAAIDTDIATLGPISADITAVSGISADVTTAAGISADISTCASISSDITSLVAGGTVNVSSMIVTSTTPAIAFNDITGISNDFTNIKYDGASLLFDVDFLNARAGSEVRWSIDNTDRMVLNEDGELQIGVITVQRSAFDVNANDGIGIPSGTTAERPSSPRAGHIRHNADNNEYEGYDGTAWGLIGAGGLYKGNNGEQGNLARGAGNIFRVHAQTLSVDTTIDADENALCAGPLTIGGGVTLTITTGGSVSIV